MKRIDPWQFVQRLLLPFCWLGWHVLRVKGVRERCDVCGRFVKK